MILGKPRQQEFTEQTGESCKERTHFHMVLQNMQQSTDRCMGLGILPVTRKRNTLKDEKNSG